MPPAAVSIAAAPSLPPAPPAAEPTLPNSPFRRHDVVQVLDMSSRHYGQFFMVGDVQHRKVHGYCMMPGGHKEFITIAERLSDVPALNRVLGMFLCEPVDDLPALRNRLTKTMGGTVNHRALENIEYIRGHRILEIIEPHWTKWTGITELIGQFAKEPDRIYAFGDDHNDLDMLTNADVSFAPANATDAAKQAASEVVPANNNDGVAIALRRLFPEVFA